VHSILAGEQDADKAMAELQAKLEDHRRKAGAAARW
jgi:hypothetical protein